MSAVADLPAQTTDAISDTAAVSAWLDQFGRAIAALDAGQIAELFLIDSHWRDLVALTWHIRTVSGAKPLSEDLVRFARDAGPHGFCLTPDQPAPRRVRRLSVPVVEALFDFETKVGRGAGVLRLAVDENTGAVTRVTKKVLSIRRWMYERFSRADHEPDFRAPNQWNFRGRSRWCRYGG